MRTLLIAAVILGTLGAAAAPARAEESAVAKMGDSLLSWFKHVKEGLSESSVGSYRQHGRISAVAAVRGASQDTVDPQKPVWKSAAAGKKSKALKAQRLELAAAVDAALAGKLDDSRAKLDAFEKAHPDSALLADAKEIRGKLDEARTAAAAPAPAEETAKAKAPKTALPEKP